jgi:hypothetical protein
MDGKGTMYKIYRHLELNDVQWLSHRIINIYIYFLGHLVFLTPPCLFDPPQPPGHICRSPVWESPGKDSRNVVWFNLWSLNMAIENPRYFGFFLGKVSKSMGAIPAVFDDQVWKGSWWIPGCIAGRISCLFCCYNHSTIAGLPSAPIFDSCLLELPSGNLT